VELYFKALLKAGPSRLFNLSSPRGLTPTCGRRYIICGRTIIPAPQWK
jgi:hypothetical protein